MIIGLVASIVGLAACSTAPKVDDRPAVEKPAKAVAEEPEAVEGAVATNVSAEACALEPEWPVFQGDSRRTAASDAPAIDLPRLKWAVRVGVQSWNNNPIVVGDIVVVGSSGDVWNKADDADGVYAIDRESGELRWFVPFEGDVNGVALAGCRIIAGSDDGSFRGIDPVTGRQAWRRDYGGKVYAQPLPVPGGVFLAGETGRGVFVEPGSGEVIWTIELPDEVRQGAAFDGESIWVGTTSGELWKVSPSGQKEWSGRAPGGSPIWGAPTVTDVGVVFGFVRDTTYGTPAVAGFSFMGAPLWEELDRGTRSVWANVRSSPAVRNGVAFHGEAYSNELIRWQPGSGGVISSVEAGSCQFPHWASPITNSEQIILPRHDGGLYAIDSETEDLVWSLKLGAYTGTQKSVQIDPSQKVNNRCRWQPLDGKGLYATPAIGRNGALYVGSGGGWLFAIDSNDNAN